MDVQAWITKGKDKLLTFGVKQWGLLLLAGICCLVIVFPMGETEEKNVDGKTENTSVQTGERSVCGTTGGTVGGIVIRCRACRQGQGNDYSRQYGKEKCFAGRKS